ncbi:unnamed protein product, partial [Iphiclides podalirius]
MRHYALYIDIDKLRKPSESVVSREASYNKMYRASYRPEQLLRAHPRRPLHHPRRPLSDICAIHPHGHSYKGITCDPADTHACICQFVRRSAANNIGRGQFDSIIDLQKVRVDRNNLSEGSPRADFISDVIIR